MTTEKDRSEKDAVSVRPDGLRIIIAEAGGHQSVAMSYRSAVLDSTALLLRAFIERDMKGGVTFKDGETIQFFSAWLSIRSTENGLRIVGPDSKMPIETLVDDITRSLTLVYGQKKVLETMPGIRLSERPSEEMKTLMYESGTEPGETDVLLRRWSDGDAQMCGWAMGRTEEYFDDYEPAGGVSVYEACLKWPQISRFLSLPAGSLLEFRNGKTFGSFNKHRLVWENGVWTSAK